jgi:hypothetical protein
MRADRDSRKADPVPPNKNTENNPMHSKEPLEKKGAAGVDVLPTKTI